MILLKQLTTITWQSSEDQANPSISVARDELLSRMMAEGKTDGTSVHLSPTTTQRPWNSTPAAQEYIDGITAIATAEGITLASATITPINPS